MSDDRQTRTTSDAEAKGTRHVLRSLRIVNPLGLHARPAAHFVKLATQFESDVWVQVRGKRVNGKSIMGLMLLEAYQGSPIVLEGFGSDAQAAIDCLTELVEKGFYES